ncbi:MAG: L,D-transpeptidase family protein [Ruminococcus sp.]|nr:L,D-transpeptidase family protein [Ruminococcus sp.]
MKNISAIISAFLVLSLCGCSSNDIEAQTISDAEFGRNEQLHDSAAMAVSDSNESEPSTDMTENPPSESEIYDSFADCSITFDFEDRSKTVDSAMIADWSMKSPDGSVMKDAAGNPMFDRDKVAAFVQQMAAETDTIGTSRSFYATVDGWITVPWDSGYSSIYGWQIDQAGTVEQLIGLMRAGETVTVEPQYSVRGYCRATDDIGTTYVEVDISEQYLWLYKDNAVVLESDIVSGTETDPDCRTPRGIGSIWSHEQQRVLGTMEVQGYETLVNYWMPFNYMDCGFHDLDRSEYGGTVYMYNGSHGCINMPLDNAKALFEMTENGIPVIVHD